MQSQPSNYPSQQNPEQTLEQAPEQLHGPQAEVLKALEGAYQTFQQLTKHEYLLKEGASPVESGPKDLVTEGAGYLNIETLPESREWGNFFNHILLVSRIGHFLAQKLNAQENEQGIKLDINRIINLLVIVHLGKRTWKEAYNYQESPYYQQHESAFNEEFAGNSTAVKEKQSPTKEFIIAISRLDFDQLDPKLQFLVNSWIQQKKEIPEDTQAHWEYMIACYADARAGQFVTDTNPTKNPDHIPETVLEGQMIMFTIEKFLRQNNIDPQQISDMYPSMPEWEATLRNQYLDSVWPAAKKRLEYINDHSAADHIIQNTLNKDFPLDTWWGRELRTRFIQEQQKESPQLTTKAIRDDFLELFADIQSPVLSNEFIETLIHGLKTTPKSELYPAILLASDLITHCDQPLDKLLGLPIRLTKKQKALIKQELPECEDPESLCKQYFQSAIFCITCIIKNLNYRDHNIQDCSSNLYTINNFLDQYNPKQRLGILESILNKAKYLLQNDIELQAQIEKLRTQNLVPQERVKQATTLHKLLIQKLQDTHSIIGKHIRNSNTSGTLGLLWDRLI